MLVFGEDIAQTDPNIHHVEKALRALELLAASRERDDFVRSGTGRAGSPARGGKSALSIAFNDRCDAIVATVVVFYRLDRLAAYCLVPLTAWVGFATVLNFAIWRLNP